MPGPIKPCDVVTRKQTSVPEGVFEAFNELIVEKMSGTRAVVSQEDVLARIAAKLECSRSHIFSSGWLDIEDVYRAAGWVVEYDKPAYNETYEATFTFRKANR